MDAGSSDSPLAEARYHTRSSIFLAAVLRAGTMQAAAKVRNMFLTGTMAESSLLPLVGMKVDLFRGALLLEGKVV